MSDENLPLTQLELKDARCFCGKSNCNDLIYFHSRCHPKTPTWAAYNRQTGVVEVTCSACRQVIVKVKVATGHVDIGSP